MNVNKAFIPLIIVASLLLGATGMYIGNIMIGGGSAATVIDQTEEEDASVVNGVVQVEDLGVNEEKLGKFAAAYDMILQQFYRDVEEQELLEGAIAGMLEVLDDPYSVYMDEQSAQEFMEGLDSTFQGIGAEVSMNNGKVTIVAPMRDSPAEKAGLRPNDQIIKVDGEDISHLSLYEAVLEIRGEKGSTVTLTIERPGVSELLDIDVVRDEIPIETVYTDIFEENGKRIGYLEIRSFGDNAATRFEEELTNLEDEGIDGLIIDVRGNPGGYLNSVDKIGSLVVPGGEPIVQIEDRNGAVTRHISNLDGEKSYPIVTLINEGSASASEILAAALKEAGGYDVVGKTTFGKGTVQQTLPMGDGSQIKLTLFKWLTSGGNFINEVGVEPTIEVSQPDFFYVSPINVEDVLGLDMTSNQIEHAQIMLEGLGFDPGRQDGYFSESTVEAVRNFQGHIGLDVTGEIDKKTAEMLQLEVVNAMSEIENDYQLKKAIEVLAE
ncbi:S41 family peptidase [Evansella sp. AB-P1]|uniref:S41 family peptidase n=1 Tax=Evansella sp. AB-P1 TaxID=3037653 RepID=UPI00241CDB1F|nr:S41 family peptidase [Evansella sp. AB-P1]MDG5786632.1 S41 family peptidase [Evansella sp. AB-P1]